MVHPVLHKRTPFSLPLLCILSVLLQLYYCLAVLSILILLYRVFSPFGHLKYPESDIIVLKSKLPSQQAIGFFDDDNPGPCLSASNVLVEVVEGKIINVDIEDFAILC